jgi:hypothetical protein
MFYYFGTEVKSPLNFITYKEKRRFKGCWPFVVPVSIPAPLPKHEIFINQSFFQLQQMAQSLQQDVAKLGLEVICQMSNYNLESLFIFVCVG